MVFKRDCLEAMTIPIYITAILGSILSKIELRELEVLEKDYDAGIQITIFKEGGYYILTNFEGFKVSTKQTYHEKSSCLVKAGSIDSHVNMYLLNY